MASPDADGEGDRGDADSVEDRHPAERRGVDLFAGHGRRYHQVSNFFGPVGAAVQLTCEFVYLLFIVVSFKDLHALVIRIEIYSLNFPHLNGVLHFV